ncbi:MAG: NAD(P)/FAD-dependent oxidoreductase [Phycisphaerales bacterium JB063]
MSQGRVVIVGGGVIGACSAYYLQKAGYDVTIVDQASFGQACSHGNCGLISPSHALPLAMPGAVAKTLPMMLKKDAPLRVAPRLDPGLWMWLTRFALRCKEAPMLASAAGRHAILQSSVAHYRSMLAEENIDCEWEDRGALFVYQTEKGMDSYEQSNTWLKQFGLGAERLDGAALVEREPAIRPGVAAGAWFYEIDAHLRPDKLMSGLRAVLERTGVTILENTKITGITQQRRIAQAVQTESGDLAADHIVLATGALTPKLNKLIGAKVPIQPGKGYSITMPRPGQCPTIPMVFQEHKICVTPFQSGYRLGSTMEFTGYDTTINPTRLGALKTGAAVYLHEPTCEPVEEEWYGWRPMTYDGKPIIDRAPAFSNVVVAAGHNMLGLSMGAGTGKLVSEIIAKDQPHLDVSAYAIDRF